jgi:hypothetical protein
MMHARLATAAPLGPNDLVSDASGRPLQVCRVVIGGEESVHRIAFFVAVFPEDAEVTLRSLAAVLAKEPLGTIGAILRESAEGRLGVEIGREAESAALGVAAAAAVMRAALSWDESPLIRVSVNHHSFAIAARYSDQGWTASETTGDAV